jgi:5'-methylthioadenosine phosphorylase
MRHRIGIIGGTGLYSLEGLELESELDTATPWGRPSSPIVLARLGGTALAFLARHGTGHVLSPSEVPYAANIFALKAAGVRSIISISAVGSLREEMAPRHFVVPDQIWDRTRGIRLSTFFGSGVVGHVSFGDPYCPGLRRILAEAAAEAGATVHDGGTYVCMEGPAFSTRAESLHHRSIGMSVVGMTALPEAKLAREAGICYATLAMVTDYDCWHVSEEEVTVEMVVGHMNANSALARRTVAIAAGRAASREGCACRSASSSAIMTAPGFRDARRMEELRTILED